MIRMVLGFTALCAVALMGVARPCSAAQISQISYSVTGGSFNGPGTTGMVTGGALTWTPGSVVSTPALGLTSGSWKLSLTGPGGAFSFSLGSGLFSVALNGSDFFVSASAVTPPGAGPIGKLYASAAFSSFSNSGSIFYYTVRALNAAGQSLPSLPAPGESEFTDALVPGVTIVKAVHFQELRDRTDLLREFA